MDHFDYNNSSSVSRLNSIEGIQFDGRAYALYDSNFKIHDRLTINFQIQTFASDGLVLWVGDTLPDSSFTIEIQNRQLVARAVARGQPFSVRTEFTKNRLCDGIWHCVQVRLDGSLLTMKVDKRQFTKTEPRVDSFDMRGPLFIAGYSDKCSPPYISVRSKGFLRGGIRNLRINNQQVDWLAPRSSGVEAATPEFHRYSSEATSKNFRQYPNAEATLNSFQQFPSSETTSKNVRRYPNVETKLNSFQQFPTSETVLHSHRQSPSSGAKNNRTYETTTVTTSFNAGGRKVF